MNDRLVEASSRRIKYISICSFNALRIFSFLLLLQCLNALVAPGLLYPQDRAAIQKPEGASPGGTSAKRSNTRRHHEPSSADTP
jgi:hypothetical protein